MAEVRLSSVAQTDFDEILDYLTQIGGNRVAIDYGDRLRAAVNRLTAFPGIGTPRQSLGAQTRMTSVDPYLIFYDGGPGSETVHVLRILHGHRDITPELIARGRQP
jgi:plasmid stabilization system protein ParE